MSKEDIKKLNERLEIIVITLTLICCVVGAMVGNVMLIIVGLAILGAGLDVEIIDVIQDEKN
jgi:uncharacterized membrane protein